MKERERVVAWAWDDPAIGAAPGMGGLEYLHAMMGKKLPPPPMGESVNMTLVNAAPGTAAFNCQTDESHYNPIGSVHGGLLCTLARFRHWLCRADNPSQRPGLHLHGDQGELPSLSAC